MTCKFCAECGGKHLTGFVNESIALFNGEQINGLSGQRCADCGEIYLDDASHDRYVEASNAAVLAQRAQEQKLLLRARKKLKLTQQQAARLTGGGHNAFSRYERGQARPMPAVINLFKLLDKHPALLDELR